jgi:hypothetical protein
MKLENKVIRLMADYGETGDLAFGEVVDRLHNQVRPIQAEKFENGVFLDYHIEITPVRAFNSVENGFLTAQLAINSPLGSDYIIYNNVAPRKDDLTARQKNAGEPFIYLRLTNGVQVITVNSGFSATLLKPFAEEIRIVKVDNDKTQFRSRDNYPSILGHVLREDWSILGDDGTDTIPDEFPTNTIAYNDGYGNLKTTVPVKDIEAHKGERRTVMINGRIQYVTIGEGIFSVRDGEFCLAKGSSGWELPNGDRFDLVELVKRGGSAYAEFAKPPAGLKVKFPDRETGNELG